MCGICGFNWGDSSLIRKMNDAQKHRGPDAEGVYNDGHVSLGHRRLAIIDLSERGKQPMSNKEGTLWITFNGEIYNFQEIREELEKKGYRFRSGSDTEVIIHAYSEFGPECVKKFNGMWAFCIYDRDKNLLFLSRDRIGKKPLYFYADKKRFIFASELKAILEHEISREIDPAALELYLSLGFIPEPYSIFKGIRKLGRSQNLILNLKTMKMKTLPYWDLPDFSPILDRKKLIKEGRDLLDSSVTFRKIADVPVGTFLSGGLDSSAVSATLKKFKKELHTFSIGFEDSKKYKIRYDESKYAYLMSNYLGTIHHHYYFGEKDFEKMISRIAFAYDEPFWDYSAYPTAKVSELARKHVTVVLTGDGGDEVFGGYYTHKAAARIEFFRKFPSITRKIGHGFFSSAHWATKADNFLIAKEGLNLTLSKDKDFYSNLLTEQKYLPKEARLWYSQNLSNLLKKYGSLTESLIKFDLLYRTLSDNFLVKTDRASMLHALEVRCPFLDYRFLEFSNKIPTDYKVGVFGTKKLMREIISDRVPKEIVNRGKQGFMPQISEWLYSDYSDLAEEKISILKSRKILSQRQKAYMEKVVSARPKTEKEMRIYGEALYKFFALGLWAERWLEAERI